MRSRSSRSCSRSVSSRSRSYARSPSIPRRKGSPSFLDKRRITRAPDAKIRYSSSRSRSRSGSYRRRADRHRRR
ncbi:unnamed protein product [Ixodes pacificus]